MSKARAVLVVLVALAATGVPADRAAADYDPFATLRPATAAERRATRPLAEAVLTAYLSGRFAPLCRLFSPAEVRRVFGTVGACQRTLQRARHPCARGCAFRVSGVMAAYLTERDNELRRSTVAWLYTARDGRRSGMGELEIRMRNEHGRWTLRSDIVEAWSG